MIEREEACLRSWGVRLAAGDRHGWWKCQYWRNIY